MKPGFTMAEAATRERQIKMRKERIGHLNLEMVRIRDCIQILWDEIVELEKEIT
jgi:aminoglycoside N3'-acetyltransferase